MIPDAGHVNLLLNYCHWRKSVPVDGYIFLSPHVHDRTKELSTQSEAGRQVFASMVNPGVRAAVLTNGLVGGRTQIDLQFDDDTLRNLHEIDPSLTESFSASFLLSFVTDGAVARLAEITVPYGMWWPRSDPLLDSKKVFEWTKRARARRPKRRDDANTVIKAVDGNEVEFWLEAHEYIGPWVVRIAERSVVPPPPPMLTSATLGDFKRREIVGQGALGTVYLAEYVGSEWDPSGEGVRRDGGGVGGGGGGNDDGLDDADDGGGGSGGGPRKQPLFVAVKSMKKKAIVELGMVDMVQRERLILLLLTQLNASAHTSSTAPSMASRSAGSSAVSLGLPSSESTLTVDDAAGSSGSGSPPKTHARASSSASLQAMPRIKHNDSFGTPFPARGTRTSLGAPPNELEDGTVGDSGSRDDDAAAADDDDAGKDGGSSGGDSASASGRGSGRRISDGDSAGTGTPSESEASSVLSTVGVAGGSPFFPALLCSMQSVSRVFLVLEFVVGGELFTHLRLKGRKMREHDARFYIAETVAALDYLHRLNIMYRDLKPTNLLLTSKGGAPPPPPPRARALPASFSSLFLSLS